MSNLLKTAVACVHTLLKRDHCPLCRCRWTTIFAVLIYWRAFTWKSHHSLPIIKCRISQPFVGRLTISKPYSSILISFSEAVFLAGGFCDTPALHSAHRFTSCNLHYSASLNIQAAPDPHFSHLPAWSLFPGGLSLHGWLARLLRALAVICTCWAERRKSSLHLYQNTWQPSSNGNRNRWCCVLVWAQ